MMMGSDMQPPSRHHDGVRLEGIGTFRTSNYNAAKKCEELNQRAPHYHNYGYWCGWVQQKAGRQEATAPCARATTEKEFLLNPVLLRHSTDP